VKSKLEQDKIKANASLMQGKAPKGEKALRIRKS
jgi:hypothetical protein